MKKDEIDSFYRALRDTHLAAMETLVKEYLGKGVSPIMILNDGLIGGMSIIGQEFKASRIWVPEVLLAARNMNKGIEILKPELQSENASSKGKFVIGTVKGDIHDIGKNLVVMMMTGAGYEVIDLGTDVPKDRFLEVISKEQPDFIGLSALLTTTMLEMGEVVKAIRQALPHPPRIVVGGAPVTQTFADEIRADGYAEDAVRAVELVNRLLSEKGPK